MQALRATRSARIGSSLPALLPQRRAFLNTTRPLRADLVQDLYLKELKSYKPSAAKPADADAHVRKFTAPNTPEAPAEGDIAHDLKAYEDTPVEVEGALAPGEEPVDKFAQFLEDELKFYEQEPDEHH